MRPQVLNVISVLCFRSSAANLSAMPHKKDLTTTSVDVPVQLIERRIYLICGHKVMIDVDGVAMLSSVLNSAHAIEVNIMIMRAFIRLRQMLESNEELNRKFAAVIRKLSTHDKYFRVVFDELGKLTEQPSSPRKTIGFKADRQILRSQIVTSNQKTSYSGDFSSF